jgi:hypothetical protein
MEKIEDKLELKSTDYVFKSDDTIYCEFLLAGKNYEILKIKKPCFVDGLENAVGQSLKDWIDVVRLNAIEDGFKEFGEAYEISCEPHDCENCGIKAHVIEKLNRKPQIEKLSEHHGSDEGST